MVDLTPIVAILQSLGPWGWGAAALLVMIQMRRNGGKTPVPVPVPSPVPAPNSPAPAVPDVPSIVDDIWNRLRERIKNRFPNVAPLIAEGPTDERPANVAEEFERASKAVAARKVQLLTELHSLPGSPGT